MTKIELTEEQKKCVECPLNKQTLIIDADPGTGKTEILRHRVKFICQQNKRRRKFILVLAVGKNISKSIKKKLKEEERTMIFYESPFRLIKTLQQFVEIFGDERQASVSREISKMFEENKRGTVLECLNHFSVKTVKGEIVIIIAGNKNISDH